MSSKNNWNSGINIVYLIITLISSLAVLNFFGYSIAHGGLGIAVLVLILIIGLFFGVPLLLSRVTDDIKQKFIIKTVTVLVAIFCLCYFFFGHKMIYNYRAEQFLKSISIDLIGVEPVQSSHGLDVGFVARYRVNVLENQPGNTFGAGLSSAALVMDSENKTELFLGQRTVKNRQLMAKNEFGEKALSDSPYLANLGTYDVIPFKKGVHELEVIFLPRELTLHENGGVIAQSGGGAVKRLIEKAETYLKNERLSLIFEVSIQLPFRRGSIRHEIGLIHIPKIKLKMQKTFESWRRDPTTRPAFDY